MPTLRNDRILLSTFAISIGAITAIAFVASLSTSRSFVDAISVIASSTISIAVISTFIAAFAGTLGAQFVADRAAERRALLDDIRGTGMAMGLAFTIANTYFSAKKQSTQELCSNYKKDCEARLAHHTTTQDGTPHPMIRFEFRPDFSALMPPLSPIEELSRVLLERVEFCRAHLLLTPLTQSIDALKRTIDARNSWIEARRSEPLNHQRLSELYFGIRAADGRLDMTYSSFMEGLPLHNDNCIGFAIALTEALDEHGKKIREQYGAKAPKISKPEFSKAEAFGLMPNMSEYLKWGR